MEPRDKVIRVRTSTYNKLAEIGNILEDYDDIITRLLEEHDEQEERRSEAGATEKTHTYLRKYVSLSLANNLGS